MHNKFMQLFLGADQGELHNYFLFLFAFCINLYPQYL